MSSNPTGLGINIEGDDLVVHIARGPATALLSILLHSKFADGPRIEFLTTPYTNALIAALLPFINLTETVRQRPGMEAALASTIELVKEWAADNRFEGEDAAELLRTAVYPYVIS